jgi:hypothetical protein
MYQTMAHRKHKVVPIDKSGENIKEEIISFESKIEKILIKGN